MHVRYTHCIGFPVMEEGGDQILGTLAGILILPDTGKIEGFFVHSQGMLGIETVFCSTVDIVRWGTRVYINSRSSLAPAEDRVRLESLLKDPRTVLGQKIRTEAGAKIGTCKDVQFNTESMHIEWLFPRKWFKWGVALPVSDIVEVKPEAIIVKDPMRTQYVQEKESVLSASMPEATVARTYKNTP